LRWVVGLASIRSAWKLLLAEELVTSRIGASEVTVIASSTPATRIEKSTTATPEIETRTPSTVSVSIPSSVAVRVTKPGGSPGISQSPLTPETDVRSPRTMSPVACTRTPGRASPSAERTVPRTEPTFWA